MRVCEGWSKAHLNARAGAQGARGWGSRERVSGVRGGTGMRRLARTLHPPFLRLRGPARAHLCRPGGSSGQGTSRPTNSLPPRPRGSRLAALISALGTRPKSQPRFAEPCPAAASGPTLCRCLPRPSVALRRGPFRPLFAAASHLHLAPSPSARFRETPVPGGALSPGGLRPRAPRGRALDSARTSPRSSSPGAPAPSPEEGQDSEARKADPPVSGALSSVRLRLSRGLGTRMGERVSGCSPGIHCARSRAGPGNRVSPVQRTLSGE